MAFLFSHHYSYISWLASLLYPGIACYEQATFSFLVGNSHPTGIMRSTCGATLLDTVKRVVPADERRHIQSSLQVVVRKDTSNSSEIAFQDNKYYVVVVVTYLHGSE
jgi:hypothetical protein